MHCNAKIEYRLMDGNELEGRVEVKYRGVWGTVCDDDFRDIEAGVFCKSLGFNGPAVIFFHRSSYLVHLHKKHTIFFLSFDL